MTATEYPAPSSGASRAGAAPLRDIAPSPLNPRKAFDPDELAALAGSIASDGLIEPLVVREITPAASAALRADPDLAEFRAGARWELIAGERRWRACRVAGLATVPVLIREGVDDGQALRLALVENLQRADLDPL